MPNDAIREELVMAAAAAEGAQSTVVERVHHAPSESAWARHGREDIQGSHSLTAPLARWAPELVEPEIQTAGDTVPASNELDFAIPESVVHTRPPLRLPEDSVCRSPIAGLVIAVLATPGEPVGRRQPVMVIEAMKMQNNVSPEVDGVVKVVHVAPGDAVKAGQVLFELA
jgi:biotin carboxyl carrier protein